MKNLGQVSNDFDVPTKKYADWEAGRLANVPTATVALLGKVFQYVGATITGYTQGTFYICSEVTPATTPATYFWKELGSSSQVLMINATDIDPTMGTFDVTEAQMNDAVDAGKVLIVKRESGGISYHYTLVHAQNMSGSSTFHFTRLYHTTGIRVDEIVWDATTAMFARLDRPVVASWGSILGTLSDQTDLQGELDAKLSLSGGTMTGKLTVRSGYESVCAAVDDSSIGFSGGTDSTKGAQLDLYGKDSGQTGIFVLSATNSTGAISLTGNADGSLKWGTSKVYTGENITISTTDPYGGEDGDIWLKVS